MYSGSNTAHFCTDRRIMFPIIWRQAEMIAKHQAYSPENTPGTGSAGLLTHGLSLLCPFSDEQASLPSDLS